MPDFDGDEANLWDPSDYTEAYFYMNWTPSQTLVTVPLPPASLHPENVAPSPQWSFTNANDNGQFPLPISLDSSWADAA